MDTPPDQVDRSHWPARAFRLGEEPSDDLSDVTTPEERVLMMWPLALEAYRLAGLEIPDYARSATPCRAFRADDPGATHEPR